MNAVNGAPVGVADVEPEDEDGEVGYGEEEEEGGELGLTGGEVVAGSVGVEIVGLGVDDHGDRGFRCAVGEEEAILVGGGDRVRAVEGGQGGRGEVAECEEEEDVVGVEDAEGRVLLDLHQHLEERLFVQEEESQPRRFRLHRRGEHAHGDRGHCNGHMAFVSKPEFLEQDHGAGVGAYGEGLYLRRGGGEKEEEDEQRECRSHFGHGHCSGFGSEWEQIRSQHIIIFIDLNLLLNSFTTMTCHLRRANTFHGPSTKN